MKELELLLNQKIKHRKSGIQAVSQEMLEEEDSLNINSCLTLLEKMTGNTGEGWYIESYVPLKGNGTIGKLKAFIRKCIRKSIHWYVEPISDAQSIYNNKVSQAMEALAVFAQAQVSENEKIKQAYTEEIEYLKNRLDVLERKLQEKENQNA